MILLLIRKNRSGSCGEIKLKWSGETTTFREISDVGVPETTVPEQSSETMGEGQMKVVTTDEEAMPFKEKSVAAADVVKDAIKEAYQPEDKEYVDDADDDNGNIEY